MVVISFTFLPVHSKKICLSLHLELCKLLCWSQVSCAPTFFVWLLQKGCQSRSQGIKHGSTWTLTKCPCDCTSFRLKLAGVHFEQKEALNLSQWCTGRDVSATSSSKSESSSSKYKWMKDNFRSASMLKDLFHSSSCNPQQSSSYGEASPRELSPWEETFLM